MFENMKFGFYRGIMWANFRAAVEAKERQHNKTMLRFLRKGITAGLAALNIKSEKIDEQQRKFVADLLISGRKVYQGEVLALMSEDDREFLVSIFKLQEDFSAKTVGVNSIDQAVGMFRIAKSRLGAGEEVLNLIYSGDHVPASLRKIMQSFLAGDLKREEVEKQLDECASRLQKLFSELLFPDGSFAR
jgi:hypothetical protein